MNINIGIISNVHFSLKCLLAGQQYNFLYNKRSMEYFLDSLLILMLTIYISEILLWLNLEPLVGRLTQEVCSVSYL
jgi:hypothetical protein